LTILFRNETKSLGYCDLLIKNKEILEKYANQTKLARKSIQQIKQSELEKLSTKYAAADNVSRTGSIIVIVFSIFSAIWLICMDAGLVFRNIRSFFDIIHKPFVVTDISRQRKFSIRNESSFTVITSNQAEAETQNDTQIEIQI
jgi:hypothetical protein